MPTWKTNDGDESPNWLDLEKQDMYGTDKGWTHRRKDGTEEILVAVRNLDTKIGTVKPTVLEFTDTTFVAGSQVITVKVAFSEKVTITGSPQITVENDDSSGDGNGNYTCTYDSTHTDNEDNIKVFKSASSTLSATDVLSVGGTGAPNIALNSGTIKKTGDTSEDAVLVITDLDKISETVASS